MKRTLSQKLKKSVSAILAAAMSLSLFTAIPVSADIGRTTYNYDGYSVDYNVTNEWDGAQTVELTVSNTGTDSILNWALKYDTEGEISNLWNASLYEQNGDEYVIKNVGWNFEIAPNQSITYGYTLNGSELPLPDNFEIYSKRVDKTDGYDVQYNITKSWDTGVEGNIVITNTSAAPIEAWTLSFDSNFTIDNLWNGRVLENNGTSYTVAAEMWTNPVQPNGSMTIGFVGSKAADIEALLSNFRLTEVVIGEGMPVIPIDPPAEEIEITANAVYDEENSNITVSWNTNNPNGTFDVLMSEDGENFVSVGTVEGVSEFVYIPENDFETLYFKVVQTVDEQTAESNVVAVVKSAEDIAISAEGTFDEQNSDIFISWDTNINNGSFEILMSNDGENFILIGTVTDESEFVYIPENDFETLYFKVVQASGDSLVESNVVAVAKSNADIAISAEADYDKEKGEITVSWTSNSEKGNFEIFMSDFSKSFTSLGTVEKTDTFVYKSNGKFEVLYFKVKQSTETQSAESNVATVIQKIDWNDKTDTDNDELTDVYEKYYFNTDFKNLDTDGDGLPDGYEVYYLGTDPTKADTDDNGITDGDEDFDKDGLSNLREYELCTDPNSADSDSDGLTDSEEVNKYNTDPLKYDTDSDGISDGDEVALGLDPTSAATNGTPDAERTFVQHIGEDSDNFAAINTSDSPYKVSIDITAAGVAANNISAQKSVYSNAINNEAVIGISPEFIYTDGLNVDDVVINFDIAENTVSNTNGKYMNLSDELVGIKRLNVFKYFEDTNILLPIETFHDVENNRVYTHVDELGTYCLMDMEIWLDSIGFDVETSELRTYSLDNNNSIQLFSLNDEQTQKSEYLDVVLVAYPNAAILSAVKKELSNTCSMIFSEAKTQNLDVRIYFVFWQGTPMKINGDMLYASNIDEANSIINRYTGITAANVPNSYMLSKSVNCIRDNLLYDFRDKSDRYFFVIDAFGFPPCNYTNGGIDTLKENNIKVYFSYSANNENYGKYLMLATDSICDEIKVQKGRYNFGDFIFEQIFGKSKKQYVILTSSGLKVMPSDFGGISRYTGRDYDNDGLADISEINTELVTFEEDGTISYKSFDEIEKEYQGFFYVEKGLERLKKDLDTTLPNYMRAIKVMPIRSDPTSPDGDEDEIPDNLDNSPLSESNAPKAFKDLIVNRVVDYDKVVRVDEKCYICTEPLYEMVGSSIVSEYVQNNGNLNYEDILLIQSYLHENTSANDELCLVGIYVGKDEMYFSAPIGATYDELIVMASANADNHRDKIIANSDLQNNKIYTALKNYSNTLSNQLSNQDEKINNILDYCYNTDELVNVLGYYDNEAIVTGANIFDSFFKSAWKFTYQTSSLLFDKNRIRSIITSTTVSYIEYDYWYRQQYPDSGIMASIPSFIGKNAEVSLEYTILDINERLMDGTPASRGEILGECLFDICLDIAIGKAVKQCADSIDAAKAVDDLDDIKTRYTTAGNIGNAAPKDVVDVFLDGKKHSITVKSTNTKLFNNLITEYGDNFVEIAVKYNGTYIDDIMELADLRGNYIINLFDDTKNLSDDIIERIIINEKRKNNTPWEIIDNYRVEKGMTKLDDIVPSPGDGLDTVSYIDVGDQTIYGVNSSLLTDSEKDLGRRVFKEMQDMGLFGNPNLHYGQGGSQVLTHAEGNAIMKVCSEYKSQLNGKIVLYCDRKICPFCNANMSALKQYYGLDEIVIINKNGSVHKY